MSIVPWRSGSCVRQCAVHAAVCRACSWQCAAHAAVCRACSRQCTAHAAMCKACSRQCAAHAAMCRPCSRALGSLRQAHAVTYAQERPLRRSSFCYICAREAVEEWLMLLHTRKRGHQGVAHAATYVQERPSRCGSCCYTCAREAIKEWLTLLHMCKRGHRGVAHAVTYAPEGPSRGGSHVPTRQHETVDPPPVRGLPPACCSNEASCCLPQVFPPTRGRGSPLCARTKCGSVRPCGHARVCPVPTSPWLVPLVMQGCVQCPLPHMDGAPIGFLGGPGMPAPWWCDLVCMPMTWRCALASLGKGLVCPCPSSATPVCPSRLGRTALVCPRPGGVQTRAWTCGWEAPLGPTAPPSGCPPTKCGPLSSRTGRRPC